MSKRFKSQDYFRYPRLGTKWRRPKGRQSKLRERKGGSGMNVSIGRRTKLDERNTINGMRFSIVRSLKDIESAEKAIIIASGIGVKKTKLIAERAKQLNLLILNKKKVKKAERIEKEIAKRKESKKEEKKRKAAEEKAKKAGAKAQEKKEDAKAGMKKEEGKETGENKKEPAKKETMANVGDDAGKKNDIMETKTTENNGGKAEGA